MQSDKLPKMPFTTWQVRGNGPQLYTEQHMREYALAARKAALEEAAGGAGASLQRHGTLAEGKLRSRRAVGIRRGGVLG